MKNMIFVSTLFFNKTGNQSFFETVKEYARYFNVVIITSASKNDSYYLSTEEVLGKFGNTSGKIEIVHVYQVIPNLIRTILGFLQKRTKENAAATISTNFENLSYSSLNLISFKVASIFFYQALRKICRKKRISLICAYEIGAVKAVVKYKKKYLSKCKFIAKYQGSVMGFDYQKNTEELMKMYPVDIEAYRLSTNFDLCAITNDGTNGQEILESFGVSSKKVICRPNGISEYIANEKNNVQIDTQLDKPIKLFTLSRLVGWKRVYLAIDIINELVNNLNVTDIILNIYGYGNKTEVSFLQDKIISHSLDDYVTIQGPVEYKDIIKVYNDNDIMLSLYKYTNVTNPVLESMFLNKPIITLYDPSLDKIVSVNSSERIKIFREITEDQIVSEIAHYLAGSKFSYSTENYFYLSWRDRICEELAHLGVLN
ncbi:MAG: glycosyltransferase [Candidatus Thermoplasmatota archaeon]|nr:glycosyltransferase [Candidatus Thermoplasmatota archaeon]